jgi:hypothetical protein
LGLRNTECNFFNAFNLGHVINIVGNASDHMGSFGRFFGDRVTSSCQSGFSAWSGAIEQNLVADLQEARFSQGTEKVAQPDADSFRFSGIWISHNNLARIA